MDMSKRFGDFWNAIILTISVAWPDMQTLCYRYVYIFLQSAHI